MWRNGKAVLECVNSSMVARKMPCIRSYSGRGQTTMDVFDRKTKYKQKQRAAASENPSIYDYIKDEVGFRMADRVFDIKRKFGVVVELSCNRGHIAKHLDTDAVGVLYQCDFSDSTLKQSFVSTTIPTFKLVVDEEFLPFKDNSLDLVVSSLGFHWVNDLPGTFRQILNSLKNDGALLASMFGGETLYELRCSLQLAELEREGGFAPHISPFTEIRDVGGLLNMAGFTMLTIDVDEIIVNYPTIHELMWDLKGMAENNCAWNRKLHLNRDTILAAAAIYKEMYGNNDGTIPATFQIIYMIGWKPDPNQPKAAARGSGTVSLKDLDKIDSTGKLKKDDD